MEKKKGRIRFISPFGGEIKPDPELKKMMDALPDKCTFKEVARTWDKWEKKRVAGYAERERNAKSARLGNVLRIR